MATTVRMEMKGLRELAAALKELDQDIQKKVARAATNAGAQVIKRLALQKVPVDTGNLKKHIVARRQRRPDRKLTSQHAVTVRHKGKGVVGSPYQVGIFNEFGTVKMSAKPWMRPAFEQGKHQAMEAMLKRLRDRIAKANRKTR